MASYKSCSNGPFISHLIFKDDLFLFFEASNGGNGCY